MLVFAVAACIFLFFFFLPQKIHVLPFKYDYFNQEQALLFISKMR